MKNSGVKRLTHFGINDPWPQLSCVGEQQQGHHSRVWVDNVGDIIRRLMQFPLQQLGFC
jgi:hypothetical protein